MRQVDDNVATMEMMEHPKTNTTEPSSMNLLFSLPPELLHPIFSLVGVENFRQDARRLCVCKKWYAYARPVLLGSLRLQSEDLYPMWRATRRGGTLKAAQKMTKHVDLTIDTRWFEDMSAWRLEVLAQKLNELTALHTLDIRPGEWKLSIPTRIFSGFVALRQLTTLQIDLSNINFWRGGAHLCDFIHQLIPTLKRLRCRLSRICDDLLESPPGDLEELILCVSPVESLGFYTRHCSAGHKYDGEHRAALEERLVQFAASMHEPKIVRLVHCFQNA